MYDYELHQLRTAELAAQAARHGLVREALKAARPRRRALRALGREAAEARLTAQRTQPTARRADRYTRAA
ncbi:hypothetical protein [Streptomyces sp. NRRL B-1347]|uniref:hypothetical protein n=1 Tax=Streptomyces sp. NRRL B-1347 TaxID=1476877 RepID=UPI00055C3634|nr:hypothetical protein [Streptomyces sp. NRRL B-1347]